MTDLVAQRRQRRFLWAGIVVMVVSIGATPNAAAQPQTLRWKWQADQALVVNVDQTTRTQTSIREQPVTVVLQLKLQLLWKVTAESDQGAEITQTIQSLQLRTQSGAGDPVEFDSSKDDQATPAGEVLGQSLRPILGLAVNLSMDNRGRITKLSVPEATQTALQDAPGDWSKLFSQEGMQDLLRPSALVLPEAAVEPGASWQDEVVASSPVGQVKLRRQYQWTEGGTDGPARIQVTTEMQTPEQSDIKLKVLDAKLTGERWFDIGGGRLQRATSREQIEAERIYRELPIKVSVDSQSTLTIEPK